MKKEIIINNENVRDIIYYISRNKFAHYTYSKINNYKDLMFYKKRNIFKNIFLNSLQHRHCNLGPQLRNRVYTLYRENSKYHNLYGPAYIHKFNNIKEYWIYHKEYTKDQFSNYLSIYNNLYYKRTY